MERFNNWVDRYPYKGVVILTTTTIALIVLFNLIHIGG